MSSKSNAVSNLIKIIGIALIATALYQELRKPPEERKWHGKILGFIPYEFRKPSIERLRERLWNPDDPRDEVPLSRIDFPSTRQYIQTVRETWKRFEREYNTREQE